MTYTEEMTTSEILLRLASMRNELLQAVNDIEKISKNICYKEKQTKPQINEYMAAEQTECKTCKHYKLTCELFSEICKYEPQMNCDTCKYDISEDDYDLYDMCEPMVEGECNYEPKDEPQTEYDKYREKIRPHDPHKDWFEDGPQKEATNGLQLFADILFDKNKTAQFLKECKTIGIEP